MHSFKKDLADTRTSMRRMSAPMGLAAVAMLLGAAQVWAHPGHDHSPGHNPHTHMTTDYSYHEDTNPYAAPEPAGDGYYWWKGNLHTHSLWSDGDQFPEVIVDWYVQHGYHFLALSDHNILSRGQFWIDPETNRYTQRAGGTDVYELYRERFGGDWVETRVNEDGDLEVRLKPLNEFRSLFERAGEFLLIEAEEITEGTHNVHVNATNIFEVIEPETGETVSDTIQINVDAVYDQRARLGRPMLPHLNHPNWRWAITAEDMVPVENLQFFEVYNGHRGVANFGDDTHIGLDRMWDIVLTRRLAEEGLGAVYGLATDDAHHYEDSESDVARPGRGWVKVRSRFLTPEHIIRALEAGDFYSSTGVTMHEISFEDGKFSVAVDPEPGVSYTIQFIGTREGYDPSREEVLDGDGEPIATTKRYSDDIGAVLEEVQDSHAVYEMTGDEIYVRAKIISSKEKENYFVEGEREKAWIQPVIPE